MGDNRLDSLVRSRSHDETPSQALCACTFFHARGLVGAGHPGSPGQNDGPRSRYQIRAERRRQRLDADQRRAGPHDDRPRPGPVLRRAGAAKERSRHHDAEFYSNGGGNGALGRSRLQPGFRRALAFPREPAFLAAEQRGQRAQSRLRAPPSRNKPSWCTS